MKPDLVRRVEAANNTLAKFKGKRFDWRKEMHCAALLRFHLKAMGHKVPPLPPLKSALAARRELDRRGAASMAGVVDALGFERIAPAAMLMGDIAFRADAEAEGMGGILICAGPFKLLGWFDNEETEGRFCVMDMSFDQIETGWRL